MPTCFIVFGIMLILFMFSVVDCSFLLTKTNKAIFVLYLISQFFSFFIKDIILFNFMSVVYIIPLTFMVIMFAFNTSRVNLIKLLSFAILISTTMVAIGYIDNSFVDFMSTHIYSVALLISFLGLIFSKNYIQNILVTNLAFVIFTAAIILKTTASINLENVDMLNLYSLTLIFSITEYKIVYFIKQRISFKRGRKNAKTNI